MEPAPFRVPEAPPPVVALLPPPPEVPDDELARRRATWQPPVSIRQARGYTRLYVDHVLQADQGADFDFLLGGDP